MAFVEYPDRAVWKVLILRRANIPITWDGCNESASPDLAYALG